MNLRKIHLMLLGLGMIDRDMLVKHVAEVMDEICDMVSSVTPSNTDGPRFINPKGGGIDIPSGVWEAIRQGRKLDGVRAFREANPNLSLKDAVDIYNRIS